MLKIKLDLKDRKILYELDINARQTYSQIAKKVKLSKQVVKYRIEQLEKEGIVKGYSTMIDTSKLGYTIFRIYLKLKNINPQKKKEFVHYLKIQKNIWAVVLTAGNWDVALGLAIKDIYQFYDSWEKILKDYLPSIKDYKVCIYSPIYHFAKAYIVGKEDSSKIRILGGKKQEQIDKIDILILRELAQNARVSLLEISKKTDKTAESISYRIKQLEKKGIIQGYRAIIDINLLGYEFYKTEFRLSRWNNFDQILTFAHLHPNIYQIDKTIGGEILEMEFHVKNLNNLLKLIEELENEFPNTIESYNYITILSEEKHIYMPED